MGPYAHRGSAHGLASGNSTHGSATSLVNVQKAAIDSQHRHGVHDRDSLAIIDVTSRQNAIQTRKWSEMDSFEGDKTRNVAIMM